MSISTFRLNQLDRSGQVLPEYKIDLEAPKRPRQVILVSSPVEHG